MSIARTGSYAFLAAISQQTFNVLHFLLIARWITPDEMGVWAMSATLVTFGEMMRLGLMQNAMVHFGAKHPDERPQIVRTGFILNVLCAVLIAAVMWGIAFGFAPVWNMPTLPTFFAWYPLVAVAYGQMRFNDACRMMEGDFRGAFLSQVVYGGTYVLTTVLLHVFAGGPTLLQLMLLQAVAGFATIPALRILRAAPIQHGVFRREWVPKLLNYGRYGLGTNLFSMLFQRVDMLLLGAFVPAAGVALYTVATRLNGYLDLPLNSLGQAFFPKIAAEKHNPNGNLPALLEKSTGLLLALALPSMLGMVLLATPLVWVLAGKQYLAAAPLVQILALAAIVKPWGRMFGVTLDAIGAPQWNFRMMLASFFVTLALNALLIPRWGVYGAAAASGLSIFVTILAGQLLLQQLVRVRMWAAWSHVLPAYKMLFGKITDWARRQPAAQKPDFHA
ncbi:MAG: lipopolysaccharide biosynthesis protein [Saprospiraceae bacterium]